MLLARSWTHAQAAVTIGAVSKDQARICCECMVGFALHPAVAAKLLAISTADAQLDSPLGRLCARALAQPYVKRKGAVLEARGDIAWLEWSLPRTLTPTTCAP